MNLGAVLITGLFAGGVSCAAVQGGLLTGLVTRQRAATVPAAGGNRRPAPNQAPARPAAGGGVRHGSAPRGGVKVKGGAKGKAGAKTTSAARTAVAVKTTTAATTAAGATSRAKPAAKVTAHQPGWKVRTVEPPPPVHVRIGRFLRTHAGAVGDDLTPVGGFLAGKLIAYTLLGALLGALGGVVQLSVRITTLAQIGAGLLVVAFGLAQLRVPGFRNLRIEPPASWLRFVRGRARSSSALAPALLGLATILVPCGITLSMEALALTSGSAWAGAATMAVFVAGTSPLFAALGYAARKAATAWQGKLAILTGLVVLGMGLYTLNTGLVRAGSPLTARTVAQAFGLVSDPPTAQTVTVTGGRQQAVLTASPGSYSPANIALRAGIPTTLVVHSDGASGCITAFIIKGKQWILPETGDTPIDLGVLQPGQIDFTCAMGMYSGVLTVTEATT